MIAKSIHGVIVLKAERDGQANDPAEQSNQESIYLVSV